MKSSLLLLFAPCLVAATPPTRQPNILLCVADDWGYPHASIYSDPVVKTPTFDRVARTGFLFRQAYSAAPSCTPSRAAILTGQAPHRLEEGGNLHGFLPRKFPVYPDLLEKAGYAIGAVGKGWGPGNLAAAGRTRNPAGPSVGSFQEFLQSVPASQPFCFWFGRSDPHRPYEMGSGEASGMKPEDVVVPPYLPDTPEIRRDILDYYFEVQRFDRDVGEILRALEASGRAENTLVVITGDNGWPFPRSKANLYDSGTRQTLAVLWPARFPGGKTVDAFVNLADLAPTFLEAAGLVPPRDMTGSSLLPLLAGQPQDGREQVFVERERHANVRAGDLSYPARAVRTKEFLYVRNFRPDRWPAGDPERWKAVGPFGDCDGSPSKDIILDRRQQPEFVEYFRLGFAKRPQEELYDLARDPHQVTNVADRPEYLGAKQKLRAMLEQWMQDTADPRATSDDDRWDKYPYFAKAANPVSR